MGNIIYIIAAVLIIGWAFGVFVFHVGILIHALLLIAIIIILLGVIRGRKLV